MNFFTVSFHLSHSLFLLRLSSSLRRRTSLAKGRERERKGGQGLDASLNERQNVGNQVMIQMRAEIE